MSGCNGDKGRRSERAICASNRRVGLQLLPVRRLAGLFSRETDICFPSDAASSSRTSYVLLVDYLVLSHYHLKLDVLNLNLFNPLGLFLDFAPSPISAGKTNCSRVSVTPRNLFLFLFHSLKHISSSVKII